MTGNPAQIAAISQLLEDGTPQQKMILKHLKDGGDLSQYEALMLYRIAALPRRISDLETHGIKFIRDRKVDETGRPYVKYRLRG